MLVLVAQHILLTLVNKVDSAFSAPLEYIYLGLLVGVIVWMFASKKHFAIKLVLGSVLCAMLQKHHLNIIVLLVAINVFSLILFWRRKGLIREETLEGMNKDKNIWLYINISFIVSYIALITIAFGSHFCLAGQGAATISSLVLRCTLATTSHPLAGRKKLRGFLCPAF